MLETLFLQILNMSFTASYVILFVLLARLLLKKAPKIFSYALWSVVLFRLVCPFSFESVFSVFSITGRDTNDIRPFPTEIRKVTPPETVIQYPNSTVVMSPLERPTFELIFTVVWLVGIAALLIYSVVSLLKLRRRLKEAMHESGNIYTSASLTSPFVMGLFHPKIYLPAHLAEEEKRYIVLHEQTHIKRFDHVVKIVSFFVLCLHWFNPLVWVAFFLSGRDMELSCDEAVIKKLGSDVKKDYSSSLLTLATGRRIVSGTPLAFGEGDTKSRIKNVLNYKKPSFWVIVVSAIAIIAIGVGLMTNPANKPIISPYVQEYIPGQGNIRGNVDIESYEKISPDFAVGAEKYGVAVFKNPHKAFETFEQLYAEGITYIQKANNLRPLSKNYYNAYKTYGWQMTGGTKEELSQAEFVSGFLDIYENSFLKQYPNTNSAEPTVEAVSPLAKENSIDKPDSYSISTLKNGDIQLTINNTIEFSEFGNKNEGFAYFEKATNHLHVGITTAFGQPKATDENPVGSLAGAKVEFDLDFTDEIKLLNIKFTEGGFDEKEKLEISEERLTEIGMRVLEIIEQSAQKDKAASLLTWAQRLSAKDVKSIELMIEPSAVGKRYKKYATNEFADIVQIINESKGKFMPYNETISGSVQTLYITQNDGQKHTISNAGNIFIIIDGQYYKGDYELLSKWNFKGNSAVPEEFYKNEHAAVIVKEGELSPDAFVTAIVQSFQIKEGVARFSIPNKAPAGYPLSRLSIHVSGAMPMGNDSTMSIHAFEQADIDKKWQLGQQYIERILDTKVPDGTEVYINVSLMEEDGNSSYYYAGNSKIFPLRVDSFTPNVKTTASTVTFTNKFNDTLKLALTLPKGFSMKAPTMGDAIEFGRYGSVLIYNGNTQVGAIHYNDFDLVRDENGDIPYMSVYNSIMLGSVASWDNEYTVVSQTKDTCIATVKPLHRIDVPGVSGAALENAVDKGILAYDATLQKYVAIYLDNQAVSDVQLADIAKSVKLSQ